MLKDGFLSRIFIRTSIVCLRAITPLCIVYCTARVAQWRPPFPPGYWILPIDIYAASEALFYFAVYLPRCWSLNRPAAPYNPLVTSESRKQMFENSWNSTRDLRGYLSLWFKGADVETLGREDVKDWIYWRLWNSTVRQSQDEEELEQYMSRVEKLLDMQFPEGHGKHISMNVTMEPLRMMHRPLFYYQLLVGGTDMYMFCRMWWNGYRHFAPAWKYMRMSFPIRPLSFLGTHRSNGQYLSYWYRPHKSTDRLPILFIHGIGVGLYFYTDFISQFASETDVGMIALEILPISSRVTHPPLRPEQMTLEIQNILRKHGWDRCMLMTHSYGSVIAAQILHDPSTASLVGPLLFVDPVAFSFHTPQVSWNFLRRKPRTASEIQLQYFASLDPGVVQALTRSFVWVENSLWREDVEERSGGGDIEDGRCTVALAGKDIITDTETLGLYLTRDRHHGRKWYEQPLSFSTQEWKSEQWTGNKRLELIWFPEANHAEIFDTKADRDRLMPVIKSYTAI